MGESLRYAFTGPQVPKGINTEGKPFALPEVSIGVFNLQGDGTLSCFRYGEGLTAAQYDALTDEGKAKIDKLVTDGYVVVAG